MVHFTPLSIQYGIPCWNIQSLGVHSLLIPLGLGRRSGCRDFPLILTTHHRGWYVLGLLPGPLSLPGLNYICGSVLLGYPPVFREKKLFQKYFDFKTLGDGLLVTKSDQRVSRASAGDPEDASISRYRCPGLFISLFFMRQKKKGN